MRRAIQSLASRRPMQAGLPCHRSFFSSSGGAGYAWEPPAGCSFATPAALMQDMSARTAERSQRNYLGVVDSMAAEDLVVETELFPRAALEFYTGKNLDLIREESSPAHARLAAQFYSPMRGGGQGDYSLGIQAKLANVEDCLRRFPGSKRAVLTLPYSESPSTQADHRLDGEAKCLRELHFYLHPAVELGPGRRPSPARACFELMPLLELQPETRPGTPADPEGPHAVLSCTGLMRANAAIIFPKNIHFIGAVMHELAWRLGAGVGSYTHFVTHLVSDRS